MTCLFGFNKDKRPKVTKEQMAEFFYFGAHSNAVDLMSDKAILKELELENQDESQMYYELVAYNMYSVIRVVSSSLSNEETTRIILDQMHITMYNNLKEAANFDEEELEKFEQFCISRYEQYRGVFDNEGENWSMVMPRILLSNLANKEVTDFVTIMEIAPYAISQFKFNKDLLDNYKFIS